MKPFFAILGVSLGLVLSVPAHAEPGVEEPPTHDNDGSFIVDLQKVGIGYGDPKQAISAGQAVCGALHNGTTGLHLIQHLQESNPSLTENGAAQFATISAKAYCPRQLDGSNEPGKRFLDGDKAGSNGSGAASVGRGGSAAEDTGGAASAGGQESGTDAGG